MPSPERIAIVGTGRVAGAVGRLLVERGAPVAAVAGRHTGRTRQVADLIGGGVAALPIAAAARETDGVIIAVSDGALQEVAGRLAEAGMDRGVALHTAGVLGPEALDPLAQAGVSCGALHPLQAIPSGPSGAESLPGTVWGLTGSGAAVTWAQEIVALLDGTIVRIPSEHRATYHAAAVLASNGIVALIDAAESLMARATVAPERARLALAPLARCSVASVLDDGPAAAFTGPVARGDIGTVAAHLRAVTGVSPSVAALYRATTLQLLDLAARRGSISEASRELARLVTTEGRSDG